MDLIQPKLTKSQRIQYGLFQISDHFLGRKKSYELTLKVRRNFYQKLTQTLKSKGDGKEIPIKREKELSVEDFKRNYLNKGIPVVLEGAAANWPCMQKWSMSYFKELHGDDQIVIADQLNLENPYESMTLAELIDGIDSGNGKYYRFYPLLERHPEHILEVDYKWLSKYRNNSAYFESFQIFMGGDKTITPLHNAHQGNLFTQVVGEKHWYLYHYLDTAIIDPSPARNLYRDAPPKTENGPFNPFEPNYDPPYELYQYIDRYKVHLKPGDILWNPPYYWHAVKNEGNSIGLGYRWLTPMDAFKTSPLYATLDSLVTNPPIWKSYQLYKDINLVHLAESGKLDDYLKNNT